MHVHTHTHKHRVEQLQVHYSDFLLKLEREVQERLVLDDTFTESPHGTSGTYLSPSGQLPYYSRVLGTQEMVASHLYASGLSSPLCQDITIILGGVRRHLERYSQKSWFLVF